MLIAVEYLGGVGVGVTESRYFRATDGKVYIVKLQNNQLGLKVLVNEYLAARFGAIMKLCFPASDIIEINEQTLQENQLLEELGVNPGLHFGSEFLSGSVYFGKHNLDKADNTKEMAGVMLFDHIFHNADRTLNRRNLLLRQEGASYKIYAIDNSHLFKSGRWKLESLNDLATSLKVYYRYSFGLLLKECLKPEDFQPYLDKVKNMTDEQIETVVQEIPEEWLPLTAPERPALIQFIKMRRDRVDDIWERLCKHIPKQHGGNGRWGRPRIIKARMPAFSIQPTADEQ